MFSRVQFQCYVGQILVAVVVESFHKLLQGKTGDFFVKCPIDIFWMPTVYMQDIWVILSEKGLAALSLPAKYTGCICMVYNLQTRYWKIHALYICMVMPIVSCFIPIIPIPLHMSISCRAGSLAALSLTAMT